MNLNLERIQKLAKAIKEMEYVRPVMPPLVSDRVSPHNWEDVLIHLANRRAVNSYLSSLKGEYKWRAGRDLALQMNSRDTAVSGRDTGRIYSKHRALARRAEILGIAYGESGSPIASFLRKQKDVLYPVC